MWCDCDLYLKCVLYIISFDPVTITMIQEVGFSQFISGMDYLLAMTQLASDFFVARASPRVFLNFTL